MNDHYVLLLALGTLAVSSGLVILTTDVISIALYQSSSAQKAEVLALVSSTFHGTTLVLMTLLVYQFFKHHNSQSSEKTKPRGYLIAFAATSCVISSSITALQLVIAKNRRTKASSEATILRPPQILIISALVSGAVSMLSQCTFIIFLACLRQRIRSSKSTELNTPLQPTEMQTMTYTPSSLSSSHAQQKYLGSTELKISSFKHHTHKLAEKISLTRSNLPSLQYKQKASTKGQASRQGPLLSHTPDLHLLDQNNRYSEGTKTSIDVRPSQSVESLYLSSVTKSVNPSFKYLGTIPASPTDPLGNEDFRSMLPQPAAKRRDRARSFSPANSYRESKRYSRSVTSVDVNRESHIHPLFRTDSSEPPPPVTPGTIVTAAPGAGQVISNRASLRSLKSKKSVSSIQSRRKKFHNCGDTLINRTENEKRNIQTHEPLPSYGVDVEALRV